MKTSTLLAPMWAQPDSTRTRGTSLTISGTWPEGRTSPALVTTPSSLTLEVLSETFQKPLDRPVDRLPDITNSNEAI